MSHDSAPGKDGLPMEFYRTFSNLIKEDFTNLVNYIFFEKKKKNCKINENSNYFANYENITRRN